MILRPDGAYPTASTHTTKTTKQLKRKRTVKLMLLLLDVEMEVVEVEMVAGAARSGVVGWAWNICIG